MKSSIRKSTLSHPISPLKKCLSSRSSRKSIKNSPRLSSPKQSMNSFMTLSLKDLRKQKKKQLGLAKTLENLEEKKINKETERRKTSIFNKRKKSEDLFRTRYLEIRKYQKRIAQLTCKLESLLKESGLQSPKTPFKKSKGQKNRIITKKNLKNNEQTKKSRKTKKLELKKNSIQEMPEPKRTVSELEEEILETPQSRQLAVEIPRKLIIDQFNTKFPDYLDASPLLGDSDLCISEDETPPNETIDLYIDQVIDFVSGEILKCPQQFESYFMNPADFLIKMFIIQNSEIGSLIRTPILQKIIPDNVRRDMIDKFGPEFSLLAECINESLNSIKQEYMKERNSLKSLKQSDIEKIFKQSKESIKKWSSTKSGHISKPQIVQDERLSEILCLEAQEEEKEWVNYEYEEIQVSFDLADMLLEALTSEIIQII